MPIKKSVRLVDDTIKLLFQMTQSGGEVNWSGSINAMAERYKLIMDDNLPPLSDKEKTAFYCAYNGYIPHPDPKEEAKVLHWTISEGYQYDEQIKDLLGSEENAVAFIEKIKLWSLTQRLSVIHMAKAYWRQGPVVE